MIYGMRSKLKPIVYHKLKIGNEDIERVVSFKYLGVILDTILSFNKHIDGICSIYAHKLYLFNKIKHYLNTEQMLSLYKAYVLPYVDYGDVLYAGANKTKLDKLQILQNQGLRLALKVNMRYAIIKLHQDAGISNLMVRRRAHLRNFMFKQKGNVALTNRREVFTRAHDACLYTTMKPKNETYKKSVMYMGAMEWNSLDVWLRRVIKYEEFKLHQKRWMGKSNYL